MAQTKPKAGQFYGVSGNGTDGQFLQTDGAGGMAWADTTVAPTLTSIDYPGTATAADTAGGESIIINGTGFQTGITCTVGGTSATTAFNSATQITITSPAKAAGQYTVAVTNTDGGNGSSANFIQYSGVPIWSTASGSLGSVEEGGTTSFQVTATEGSDTIEYAVTSGSLPSGYSLATATGAITGTAPSVSADTTSTFSITATDDENQTSSARSFSITVTAILPSQHFNTTLYTGTGSTLAITGVSFQPDMVWVKNYGTAGYNHCVQDSVRGPSSNLYIIYPDGAWAQATNTTSDYFQSLNSDGFSVGGNAYFGASSNSYVGYSFKGGGTPSATNSAGAGNAPTSGSVMIDGSASTATLAGTIAADKISANTTLGFSTVEYTGNATSGATVAHGLDVAPEMIFVKNIDSGGNNNWSVYSGPNGATGLLYLNLTYDFTVTSSRWNDTAPTNQLFTLGNDGTVNASGDSFIAYCFASKAGLSKVGSFTGNGGSSKIIETGFRVGWVLLKNTTTNGYRWYLLDDKRGGSSRLFANNNDPANTNQKTVKFLENGFEVTTSDAEVNKSGDTIVYLAFASDGSSTTPSLASSFSATENTSPSTNQAIAAGFTPDMVWIKGTSTSPTSWGQYDTIRGDGEVLQSDNDQAEYDYSGHPSGDLAMKFSSTGYTTPPVTNDNINNSSGDFINYFWKGGGLASINNDGTNITSIVSANVAAGFSIVNWVGSGTSGDTVGHGLTPAGASMLVIMKDLSAASDWMVITNDVWSSPNQQYLKLNTDAAIASSGANIYNVDNTTFKNDYRNTAGNRYIAYCWHSVSGFSKAGSYTGNNPTAVSVNLGFNPDLIIIKNGTNQSDWTTYDKQRSPTGNFDDYIYLNTTGAQGTTGANWITPTATGFTTNSSGGSMVNENGSTFVYLAFKQN